VVAEFKLQGLVFNGNLSRKAVSRNLWNYQLKTGSNTKLPVNNATLASKHKGNKWASLQTP